MAITFNPFTGNFDYVGGASTLYLPTVQSETDLPAGDPDGAVRIVRDTDRVYVYDLNDDTWTDSGISLANFAALANAQGISISLVVDNNIVRPTLTLHPADATNPGGISTTSQEFGGNKDFQNDVLVQGTHKTNNIDSLSNGGTLAIGNNDASTINIGRSGATINIIGSTINQTVTNLNVQDKHITVNLNGASGSGGDAGIEVEENGSITGFTKVAADRLSWRFKAPGVTGEFFIAPNNNGFNQVLASSVLTSNRVYTLPDAAGTLVLDSATQTLTNKSIDADTNIITNIDNADIKTNAAIDATKIYDGSVDNTEFSYLNGVTSGIQSQLNNKQPLDSTLTALAAYNTNGLLTQTTTDTFVGRSIAVGSTKLSVSNGDGVAGNPTLDVVETNLNLNNQSGILDIDHGGTNSNTPLNNDRIIHSAGGAIVERAAMTDGQLIIGSNGTSPVNATLTASVGISITNGAGSITIGNTNVNANDIPPTIFAAAQNQSSAVNVTGLSFSNAAVRSFVIEMDIILLATTPAYQHYTIKGIQRGSDWIISQESLGDASGVAFNITNAGQIQYISNSYTGFTSLTMKFYAKVMPI